MANLTYSISIFFVVGNSLRYLLFNLLTSIGLDLIFLLVGSVVVDWTPDTIHRMHNSYDHQVTLYQSYACHALFYDVMFC